MMVEIWARVRGKIKGSTFTQLISIITILVLISFINFNLNTQRKTLEEALLAKGINMAWMGASITRHVLEDALDRNILSEDEAFDTDYIEIAGTDPSKYHTSYDSYLDANLQTFEDDFLRDSDVTYALAVDINGYAPSHNTVYSHALTGDYETDLEFSRSKRIFSDEIGIEAARNEQSYLWQIYYRDTGEVLWDISAPIVVNGRHWGAFRVGFSLERIDEKTDKAEKRILFPAIWLVCGMLLVTYWVARLQTRLEHVNLDLSQEIEQRKSIQADLAKENELLNFTLCSMAEAVITVDRNGKITTFNPGAEHLTGFTSDEALGSSLEKILVVGGTSKQNGFDFLQSFTDRESISTLIRSDGNKILIESNLYPLKGEQNEVAGYVFIGKNITQKHQDEIESTLSQKMESIGRLASGIAHEINTPIQYVGDNIHYLNRVFHRYEEALEDYQNFLVKHQNRILTEETLQQVQSIMEKKKIAHYRHEVPDAIQEAMTGIGHVRDIVLALREFAHPSLKGKKYADINRGIKTTVTISRNEWKSCAEIETDLAEDLPPVYCQIDEINQVMLNIIINAAQAIQQALKEKPEEKGKILISTRQDGEYVIITVQDTGKGIPEDIIHRVFDPFFTTKEVNKGKGQGLALAHNIIVKGHNGKISVDSQIGKGSTFRIELPVEKDIQ